MVSKLEERWKDYIPALVCFGGVLLVLVIPMLAVLFVVLGLTTLGSAYAYIVHRMHQIQEEAAPGTTFDAGASPTFKNVSISIVERVKWWKD